MDNIFVLSEPFLRMLKYFGFLSLTFDGPVHEGNLRFTFFDKINLTLRLLFALVLLILQFVTSSPEGWMQSDLSLVAWSLNMKLDLIFLILCFLHQFKTHGAIMKFFKSMNHIDRQVGNKKNFFDDIFNYFSFPSVVADGQSKFYETIDAAPSNFSGDLSIVFSANQCNANLWL